jgi:hypothetical protein
MKQKDQKSPLKGPINYQPLSHHRQRTRASPGVGDRVVRPGGKRELKTAEKKKQSEKFFR